MKQLMNQQKFNKAKELATQCEKLQTGIGTLKEGMLHLVLKHYIEEDITLHEVKIGCFVADVLRDNEIIEIQTRAFSKLRKKLSFFLEHYQVTIVYPIAYIKWLAWINPETGEISSKRKSPKKGTPYEILFELYRIKEALKCPNLSICIMLINLEEYKLLNGWSYNKKRGAHRQERIPLELIDVIVINSKEDYLKLIPNTLAEVFTSKDFRAHTKLSLKSAQTALNVLTYVEAVKRIGKKGNAYLYKRGK